MPHFNVIRHQAVSSDHVQRAKELRDEMTPAECKLWDVLRANRLGGFHFRRQQIVGPYFVDFYCHQAGLVIELDGGIHQGQQDYDQDREQYLKSLGLQVLRFTNEAVFQDFKRVSGDILTACNSATEEDQ